jgi:hypothetical protein
VDVGDQVPDLVSRCRHVNRRRTLHGLIQACSRAPSAWKCACSLFEMEHRMVAGKYQKWRGRNSPIAPASPNLVSTIDPR